MDEHTSSNREAAPPDQGEVTRLLASIGGDDDAAAYDRLLPLIYDELRRLAGSFMDRERSDHTLQPTALVNEAFIRLSGQRDASWKSKGHFFAIAATAMRRILVDDARAHARRERGDRERSLLESEVTAVETDDVDLVALDDAMKRLAEIDPRKVQVVELRFFVGLDVERTAVALDISSATVKREWRLARLWLKSEITGTA